MRGGGWKNGPELIKSCPFYDNNGWLPAATHGWYSTMQEYGDTDPKKIFQYEYGSAAGYRVNHQLRLGERIVRNWSNKGLHVNMDGGGKPGALDPKDDILRYSAKDGDLAPGRIGNGTHEYVVPVASAAYRGGALEATNLSPSSVKVEDATKPAILTIGMRSSYVYLSGSAKLKTTGPVAVALSDNNGLDWKDLATLSTAGEHAIDLKPHIFRRYDYRIRFTLTGANTSIDALTLSHDIQHSQRVLPALDKGENKITFSAGPAEGTITVEGSLDARNKGKQLTLADFHVTSTGLKENFFLDGAAGQLTIPVATPGDIRRLRLGAHYRARGATDAFTVDASFDEGKTWKPMGQLKGPTPGHSASLALADVPPNSRSALVRLSGVQRNTLGLFDLRLDADYAEPNGGFAPVKVTYLYNEASQSREQSHTATGPAETWTITCAQRPVLKSIILERPN